MATKLRLRLQALRSASALKAFAFGGLLLLVRAAGPHLGIFLFFAAGTVFLYAVPFFRTGAFLAPLALLIVCSFLALALITRPGIAAAVGIIAVATFYLMLALKGLQLIYRDQWHHLLVLLLTYLFAVSVLSVPQFSRYNLFVFAFAFLGFFFLYRELFRAYPALVLPDQFRRAVTAVGALLSIELFWATQLLPLGSVNAANLNLVSFFLISDSVVSHCKHELDRERLTRNMVLFLGLGILIFAASEWRISI